MKITILTMFPEYFESFLSAPIPKRAMDRGIAQIELVDIKDYAGGCYRHIDDSTFGGGAGMVMRAQPVLDALAAVRAKEPGAVGLYNVLGTSSAGEKHDFPVRNGGQEACSRPGEACERTDRGDNPAESAGRNPCSDRKSTVTAALTPVGRLYCQETAARYAGMDHLILICGHYEGMDERIYAQADERVSIGDYVLSGGEPAAMVVMDSVLRLLPGVLRAESTAEESFCGRGLLEYPQYTRPADLNGDRVPDILLSGNHEEIRRWRLRESLRATLAWRPELLDRTELTEEEQSILSELKS